MHSADPLAVDSDMQDSLTPAHAAGHAWLDSCHSAKHAANWWGSIYPIDRSETREKKLCFPSSWERVPYWQRALLFITPDTCFQWRGHSLTKTTVTSMNLMIYYPSLLCIIRLHLLPISPMSLRNDLLPILSMTLLAWSYTLYLLWRLLIWSTPLRFSLLIDLILLPVSTMTLLIRSTSHLNSFIDFDSFCFIDWLI